MKKNSLLINLIWSIHPKLWHNEDEFFMLRLEVKENKSAVVKIDYGTGDADEIVYRQRIPFSDFPFKEQTFYVISQPTSYTWKNLLG